MTPSVVAALIDHTLLKPDTPQTGVEQLCREATEFKFATVCVNPTWVKLACEQLRSTQVGVCAVVGFPFGANTTDIKRHEAERVILDGASEVDVVINVGALRSGDLNLFEHDIGNVVQVCRENDVISKVIIEAALLTNEQKVVACQIAKTVGAMFVKTSTGFGLGGATVEDVALMRKTVGAGIGVKAAGGVRDYDTLQAMLRAGATRIGSSSGVYIVQEVASRMPRT